MGVFYRTSHLLSPSPTLPAMILSSNWAAFLDWGNSSPTVGMTHPPVGGYQACDGLWTGLDTWDHRKSLILFWFQPWGCLGLCYPLQMSWYQQEHHRPHPCCHWPCCPPNHHQACGICIGVFTSLCHSHLNSFRQVDSSQYHPLLSIIWLSFLWQFGASLTTRIHTSKSSWGLWKWCRKSFWCNTSYIQSWVFKNTKSRSRELTGSLKS